MKKLRVYVDTSVSFDPEFADWSNRLLREFRSREFAAVLSAVTATEVEQAPEPVRRIYDELVAYRDRYGRGGRCARELELSAHRAARSNPSFQCG